jgi:hypothetical protein
LSRNRRGSREMIFCKLRTYKSCANCLFTWEFMELPKITVLFGERIQWSHVRVRRDSFTTYLLRSQIKRDLFRVKVIVDIGLSKRFAFQRCVASASRSLGCHLMRSDHF